MRTLATKMGIDRRLMSLRNQLAHGAFPPLHSLVEAAQLAMDWLKTNYWEPEIARLRKLVEIKRKRDSFRFSFSQRDLTASDKEDPILTLVRTAEPSPLLGKRVVRVFWESNRDKDRTSLVEKLTRFMIQHPPPGRLGECWGTALGDRDQLGLSFHLLLSSLIRSEHERAAEWIKALLCVAPKHLAWRELSRSVLFHVTPSFRENVLPEVLLRTELTEDEQRLLLDAADLMLVSGGGSRSSSSSSRKRTRWGGEL